MTAGWHVKGDHELILRRSGRIVAERRFLRPGGGAASTWIDIPTTATEETTKIPPEVVMMMNNEIAVPNLEGAARGRVRIVKTSFAPNVQQERLYSLEDPPNGHIVDESSDDDTAEMDTVDQEREAAMNQLGVEPWEMRF